VIVALNGNPIRNNADLVSTVSDNPVGSKATLLVVRKGQEKEFRVTIGDRMNVFANDSRVGKKSPEQATVRKEPTNYKLGFLFKALTEADKEELNFKQAGGVLITEVDPASLADDIDLKANDVIVEINR
jgi:serine protease Do